MRKEDIIKMRIARVKKEIRDTPYDKASEHHHGRLKAKLAKLTTDLEGSSGGGGGGGGYAVRHSGDACVVLVGLPSVGKSTLLNALTNAESKVGNYDFTTLGVVPGMMAYRGVNVQILDLPGILQGATNNKGFGRKVLSVIRAADLVVLMTDIKRLEWLDKMEKELYLAGIRLGGRPPLIKVKRMAKGSIQVVDPYKSFSKETVVEVAKELGFSNAVIQFEEKIENLDTLVDALVKNRRYLPVVKVVNKVDEVERGQEKDWLLVSAEKKIGLDKLREEIWQKLGLVRIYLKRNRKEEADKKKPLIVGKDKTLLDVVKKLSGQMAEDSLVAYIWGEEAKFPGQKVLLKRKVFDEMEVFFGR